MEPPLSIVISALCNEVKSIQEDQIHFEFDPKNNQIIKKQSEQNIPKFQKLLQNESGLLSDYYKDEAMEFRNLISKQDVQVKLVKKRPSYQTIRQIFSNTPIVMDVMYSKFENNVINKNLLSLEFANIYWLTPLRLPEEFYYIDVIMFNNPFQGLLHSFVRHWNVWSKLVPQLEPILKNLTPIQSYLELIKNSTNQAKSGAAINQLNDALKKLMHDEPIQFISIKLALLKAQFHMHNFIKENLKFDQLKGSDETMFRECFNVTDKDGNTHVMTLCQTKQLFPEIDGFGSANMERLRHVRIINTIFFLNEAKFEQLSMPQHRSNSNSSCEDSGFFNDIEDMLGYGLQDDRYKIDTQIDRVSQSEQMSNFSCDNNEKLLNFPKSIRQKLASVKFISDSELVKFKKELPNLKRKITRHSIDDKFEMLTGKLLLHEQMTKSLDFTGAVMTNNASQGLLHSFVRHWDQWVSRVEELKSTMKSLKPIRSQLDKIKDAPNRKRTYDAINELKAELEIIDQEQKIDVLFALLEAQLLIHEFIQKKVNTENYTLERIDLEKQCYVDYKVDADHHLRIGVSKECHSTVKEFGDDNRPVRFITVLYFTTWNHSTDILLNFITNFIKYALTPEEQKQRLNEYRTQGVQNEKLSQKYSKSTILSNSELDDLKNDFDEPQPGSNNYSKYSNWSKNRIWLHVQTPEKLDHTCAIMTYSFDGGLLHSLARHFRDWSRHIGDFGNLLDKLASIMELFQDISDLPHGHTETLKSKYKECYTELNLNEDLRFARFETEMQIYKCILKYVTPAKFLRVGVSNKGQIRIYFQTDIDENSLDREVMALCVSKELFPFVEKLSDKPHNRPVRTIITAFFKEWEAYDQITKEEGVDDDDDDGS